MKLNFGTVPFSYAGSYMAFSYPQDDATGYEKDLTLRILYGFFTDQENFPIYLMDESGNHLQGEVEATPEELSLRFGSHYLTICFQNEDTFWIRGNCKAAITKRRLSGADRIMEHDYGTYEIAGYHDTLMIEMIKGRFLNNADWDTEGVGCSKLQAVLIPDEDGLFECQVTLSTLSYKKPEKITYDQALCAVKKEYSEFARPFVTNQSQYASAMEEAAYISWHTIVNPRGYVKYPVMLMTKNKMNQVWSWDYTINALAMTEKHPKLAYDQFLAMAACQDETGFYADCFQARTIIRGFVKPPVQGFMLRKMFEINRPDDETVKALYETVAKFTDWWFNYRARKDGIPEYLHGNDSGWDNSTVFGEGLPVKSPDLCAWLVDQMDFLKETAGSLGLKQQEAEWKKRSDDLLAHMLTYFVVDNRFVAYKEPEHTIVECDSLLLYLPLILGDRLPEALRQQMLTDLLKKDKFITSFGIASEPLTSSRFVEDGYWRGAIWPPTALILTEALLRNGKKEEALANAVSFCDMCAKVGFFENYSALDGHGLRDSGFTWTASAFMVLLRDYVEKLS